jgi:phospholipase C
MTVKRFASQVLQGTRVGLASLVMLQMGLAGPFLGTAQAKDHDRDDGGRTRTPIKHVIVIVGENRTFDHIFATYEPKGGESIQNLLSEHIIKEDGTPGKNFADAYQYSADATDSSIFQLAPKKKTLFSPLPAELNGGPTDVCKNNGICTLGDATSSENGLATGYYQFMLTGGSELTGKVPDSRITGVHNTAPYSTLPPGPFQLSNGKAFTDDSYAASPVHRFYQMWQQEDCDASHISKKHPNGCLADLFAWTEVTVGSNNNGNPQPANFSTDYAPGKATTGEGATTMGFYNMARGDAKYTKYLADHYAMSDNYHQPAMGGTGLDEIMLYFADPIWFSKSGRDTGNASAQRGCSWLDRNGRRDRES